MALSPANSSGAGYPLSLPGAVQPTRFVGGTAAGAPVAGTFAIGDFVVTQDGSIYICTIAGTPGTWAAVSGGGGGGELAYAEITATVTVTATTEASANTIVSLPARTYDGATVILLEFFSSRVTAGAGAGASVILDLWDAAIDLGQIAFVRAAGDGLTRVPVFATYRLTPTAGSHTYIIKGWRGVANGEVQAGGGGISTPLPAFLRSVAA